jgi:hypothetical protein
MEGEKRHPFCPPSGCDAAKIGVFGLKKQRKSKLTGFVPFRPDYLSETE